MWRKYVVLGSAAAVGIAAAGVIGGKIALPHFADARSMCAEFPDAVGLYPGNKVQLLGIEVGSVTAVVNEPEHVRVDFTVPKGLDLPADVGAVTYSQSIVSDRHVELTKPYSTGPKFAGPGCIGLKSTKTPIGVSETLSAVAKLTGTVLGSEGGQDPMKAPGAQAINDSLQAVSRSLQGTGPVLNQTLRDLAGVIGDPQQANGDYGQLLRNSEILTSGLLAHWDTLATVVTTLPASLKMIEGLSDGFGSALDHLARLLPVLVDALNRYAPRFYRNVDKLIPWARDVLNAYTPQIAGLINGLPPLTNWLAARYPQNGQGDARVTYVPPRVALSPPQASAVCAVLQQRGIPAGAAACAAGGASAPATLGLTDLIMGNALP